MASTIHQALVDGAGVAASLLALWNGYLPSSYPRHFNETERYLLGAQLSLLAVGQRLPHYPRRNKPSCLR
jgi:hypothetical protein